MGGIPSWAVKGAKVVAIDTSPSEAGDGWAGIGLGLNEIFTLLRVKQFDGEPMCQTIHDASGERHSRTEWARLSRFRPLRPAEQHADAPMIRIPHHGEIA